MQFLFDPDISPRICSRIARPAVDHTAELLGRAVGEGSTFRVGQTDDRTALHRAYNLDTKVGAGKPVSWSNRPAVWHRNTGMTVGTTRLLWLLLLLMTNFVLLYTATATGIATTVTITTATTAGTTSTAT